MQRSSLLLLTCCVLTIAPALAQRGNVLIIVADDVGIEKLGAYGVGPGPPPTPNLDALASGGVMFRNAWSYTLCSPTRACIMSGRYGVRTGVGHAIRPRWFPGVGGVLREVETTIPELLDGAGAGYAHAAIGKWHLSDYRNGGVLGPNVAGWSHYAGVLIGVRDYYSWPRTVNGVTTTSNVYHTTQTVDDALEWLSTAPEPWVCYVAFQAIHTPFHAPPVGLHSYDLTGLSPAKTPLPFARAMLEAMDTEIGRLLAGLGSQRARTDIIFISDNGTTVEIIEPPFGPHQVKGSMYQGGINVPLIVSGPSVNSPGREVDFIVGAVDVFATVAELCGVDPQPPWVGIDSVSLVPYLENESQGPLRDYIMAEQFTQPQPEGRAAMAIRDRRHKLIRRTWRPQDDELYDLLVDPLESNELLSGAPTPKILNIYQALLSELQSLRWSQPSLTAYGDAGCVGSHGIPVISGSGLPVPGVSYDVQLGNAPPLRPAWFVIGASRTRWGAFGLPLELSSFGGGPGCSLWASLNWLAPDVTDANGTASITVLIPNDPVFVAGSLHHSWLISDPTASPLGLTTSGGLVATVGVAGQ